MICLNRRYFFGVLLIFFAVDLATQLGAAQTSGPLVLQGGTLIDATGRPPIEDAVIVVEGNSIKSVGKRGDVAIPRDARVIDVKGKTVLPGLIDGHCHLLDFVGEIYLHLGITTCPDITQNDDEWTLAERQGTNLGKIRGPRIWSTGSRLVGPPLTWALRGERGYLIKTPEEFVSKSGRNLDAAAIEYLYRLYITEVIPPRPHLKIEGIELATQMSASLLPSARAIKAEELIDARSCPSSRNKDGAISRFLANCKLNDGRILPRLPKSHTLTSCSASACQSCF